MEIKSHIFFSPINWDDLINKKITPPFNPNVVRITSNYRMYKVSSLPTCYMSLWGTQKPEGTNQVAVFGKHSLSFPCGCLDKVKNKR